MPFWRNAIRLLVVLSAVLLTVQIGQSGAEPEERPAPAAWPGGSASVTLITGDRVLVGPNGALQVLSANGSGVTFRSWQSGGNTYVVPSSVASLVPKVLDPALFNVTGLVAAKLDDAHSQALPVLVQHEDGVKPAALAAGGPLRATRELSSIKATAARLDKKQAGQFGKALAGVRHIWLDAPIHPLLDANLTQIGAPAAWNSGLSGSGVKVAVLDSGIDKNHPDLAGQVIAEADFTGSPDTADRIGHGTHVAAILAGTGVQSGAQRKGVSFGARLLNGKVLGENGGTVSTAIAGMEWATQQGADVVNMSIGVDVPSDGTDPWSQAVNTLTQSTGTLFVVAAGNTGPGPVEIGAPASADAALTVAAVDSNNRPAEFTSPGPRLGDRALKPDISAPGVDIISARASGTTLGPPVDGNYVRASGTSMASPHVAGAAALLVQRHPDWTPAQLKAALVGTAQPASGVMGYVQGGGRVDLAHAIAQRVFADVSNVDFKGVAANAAPTNRTVTLRNTGTTAVTVNTALALRNPAGQAAPGGLFSVSPASVSLPAGGTGTVTVRLTPSASATGEYSGGLTLTPSGGGRALRLPVAGIVLPPTVTVTLRGIRRDGSPHAGGLLQLFNVDDAALTPMPNPINPGGINLDAGGEATVQVVAGRYSTMSSIDDPGSPLPSATSLVGSLETMINQNTTIVLDARDAQPVSPSIAGIGNQTPVGWLAGYTRLDRFGRKVGVDTISSVGPGASLIPLFVQPTSPVTTGSVETRLYWKATGTDADGPAEVFLPFVEAGFRTSSQYSVSAADLASYARTEGDYRAFGNDAYVYGVGQGVVTPSRGAPFTLGSLDLTFPLARTEYFRPDPKLSWFQCVAAFIPMGPPVDQHCELDVSTRPAGSQSSKRWLAGPMDPMLVVNRTSDLLGIVTASPHGDGDGRGQINTPVIGLIQSSFQIFRDGVPINASAFSVPLTGPSTIRVDGIYDLDPNAVSVPSSTRVSWSFTTRPPSGSTPVTPPVLVVDVRAPGLDNRNLATPGAALTLEVNPHTIPGATPVAISWVETFVSADNGQTWQWLTLTRGNDGLYRGTVPATLVQAGGALGIHVRSGDTEGNSVDQTQLHAVRVAS